MMLAGLPASGKCRNLFVDEICEAVLAVARGTEAIESPVQAAE